MNLVVAYLAQGKVRLKEGEKPARTIDSPYVRATYEKAVRSQQRHAWKSEGGGFLSGASLWGGGTAGSVDQARITSLCRGNEAGQIVYSMTSGSLCALLSADRLGEEERRLWNNNQHRLQHLSIHPATGDFAFASLHPNGTANIGVMFKDESGLAEITEGDSIDTAPSWVPGEGRKLVYQSAGIGRNRHGQQLALGPFRIESVDIDSVELTTLAEEPDSDLLAPRVSIDGALYFIRRPYEGRPRVRPWRIIKDVLLFPFRLIYAVFQFFNFFSMRYTGRKLTTSADGARGKPVDLQQMLIFGNLVQAQRAAEGEEPPDLVPSTWQLVCRRQGSDQVVARGVLAYDLAPDGTVVYSNGSALFSVPPAGGRRRLLNEAMIEQVTVVAGASPAGGS